MLAFRYKILKYKHDIPTITNMIFEIKQQVMGGGKKRQEDETATCFYVGKTS